LRNVLLVFAGVAMVARAAAQAPPAPSATAAIVEQAGKYVTGYLEAFSAVVSEEKQTQRLIRYDGRVSKVRDITADFLLVKTGTTWPQAYRDVIEVDGKRIRNREDRLKKLFLEHPKNAAALAGAIAEESGRYNIGIGRRGNSPLVPVVFLTPDIASGVRFEGTESALTFQEIRTPTVLRRRSGAGDHNMPAHGTFEIEPGTGRVLSVEFTADNPDSRFSASYKVRYAIDPKLEISVPVELTERYWRPDAPGADVLEVRSTYSSFRRFDVTTTEQIKK